LESLLVYDPETGDFWRDGKILKSKNTSGYIQFRVKGKKYCAHKLAWLYVYGEYVSGDLDHINRIKDDNRIVNLRKVTRSENCQNRGMMITNTSGVHLVSWRKRDRKWIVQKTIGGKRKAKMFVSLQEAKAYAGT